MEQTGNTNMSDQQDAENGKTVAILSYITIIGWLIAFLINNGNKTRFGGYHLRQGLGLSIIAIGLSFVFFLLIFIMPFFFWLIRIIQLGLLVLVILGIINAANGKKEPLPLVGDFFDKAFSGIN